MSVERPRTVWILGAGFSQPLGGPLFGTLLAPGTEANIRTTFSRKDFPAVFGDAARAVVALYNYGIRFRHGMPFQWTPPLAVPGEDLWEDAEEFLSYLDSPPDGGKRLLELIPVLIDVPGGFKLDALNLLARRMIAAQCSAFLRNAAIGSERWAAHLQFARFVVDDQLGEHRLLTFNYDTAVERAFLEHAKQATLATGKPQPTRLHVEGPDRFVNLAEKNHGGSSPLYKLHGSTNWYLDPQKTWVADSNEYACLNCEGEILLGTPGLNKAQVIAKLNPLWSKAIDELTQADIIVFVGYRFRKTDATARQKILGAIRDNRSNYLRVHTVLGPDLSSTNAVRLRGLLTHALANRTQLPGVTFADSGSEQNRLRMYNPGPAGRLWFRHQEHPMWAEDFLSLVPGTLPFVRPEVGQP